MKFPIWFLGLKFPQESIHIGNLKFNGSLNENDPLNLYFLKNSVIELNNFIWSCFFRIIK